MSVWVKISEKFFKKILNEFTLRLTQKASFFPRILVSSPRKRGSRRFNWKREETRVSVIVLDPRFRGDDTVFCVSPIYRPVVDYWEIYDNAKQAPQLLAWGEPEQSVFFDTTIQSWIQP